MPSVGRLPTSAPRCRPFSRNSPPAVSRFFVLKAWLGGAGLVAGLAGMAWERRWLVDVAIGLLAVAFLLRFGERRRE